MNRRNVLTWMLSSALILGIAESSLGKVVHVSPNAPGDGSGTSWENACTSISAGVTASASGDEVWVASGRYAESVQLTDGVAVFGGFRGTETLREDREWSANETIINATGLEFGREFPAVMGSDGSDPVKLTGDTTNDQVPAWRP